MQIFREYTLGIISLIVTLILTLIGEYVIKLSDEGTYITFAVGATITLAVTLLKYEQQKVNDILREDIRREFRGKLELYDLYESIDDQDLQSKVSELARNLSKGEIPPYIAAVRSREILPKVKKMLQGSDYSTTLEGIYKWRDEPRRITWLSGNKEALARGVIIERIFVLSRSLVMPNRKWDKKVFDILKEQHQAGIKVKVLWIEDITTRYPPTRNLEQNFAIYDGKEILVEEGRATRMYKIPSEKVHEYIDIFAEQRKFSHNFDNILED
jgi:hypothetical protein